MISLILSVLLLVPQIFQDMPNVQVEQDSAITQLMMDKINGVNRETTEMQGYRVQVYSSNNQQIAKQEAIELEKQLSEVLDAPVYVVYTPPFWKVRIGNFRTQEDANNYKKIVIQAFPERQSETYIVRDKIQIQR